MKPEPPTRTYPLKEELHLGHTCKGVLEDGKKILKVENRQEKTFVRSLGRSRKEPADFQRCVFLIILPDVTKCHITRFNIHVLY
jgi:hypothetical protein